MRYATRLGGAISSVRADACHASRVRPAAATTNSTRASTKLSNARRAAAPCVLVIDELHALAPAAAAPGSIEVRLALQLADGLQELRTCAVFTLGICREPDTVHASVRRSGRLHHALAIRAPSAAERADILERDL